VLSSSDFRGSRRLATAAASRAASSAESGPDEGSGIIIGPGVSDAGSKMRSDGRVSGRACAAVVGVSGEAALPFPLSLPAFEVDAPPFFEGAVERGFGAAVVVVTGGGSETSMGRMEVGAVVVVVGAVVAVVGGSVVVVVLGGTTVVLLVGGTVEVVVGTPATLTVPW
jgi:hypothetical protein